MAVCSDHPDDDAPPVSRKLVRSLGLVSRAAGALCAALGGAVLLGWAADASLLKSLLPGLVEMKANTAVCFGLAGSALLVSGRGQLAGRVAAALASVVALVGALTCAEFLLGVELGIDQLLFVEPPGAAATRIPGRMAPATAVSFLLIGLALGLALLDPARRRRRLLAEALLVPVALVTLLVFVGYAFGVDDLLGAPAHTPMALNTALGLALLCAGLLAALPDGAFSGLLTSRTAGGEALRRFLPVALAPVALTWLGELGRSAGLYEDALGFALVAVANVATLATFVYLQARALRRLDLARSRFELDLRRANEELEERIAERTAALVAANAELRREQDALHAAHAEEQKSREELARARSQLELSARMAALGTMAAGVGHEINNPLAYVVANLAYLAEELPRLTRGPLPGPAEEILRAVDEARDGADRVRRIVQDLRSFARGDEAPRAVFPIRRALDWSTGLVAGQIRDRARLVQELGETPPVQGTEPKLGQVFVNLLANAAHAVAGGGPGEHEVRVVTRTDHRGWCVVEIHDTGSGIAPELLGRIFEPFFTTKPVGVGTGLGLSICHDIVSDHGGELSVESVVGAGTCFRVALPPARAGEVNPGGGI